MGCLSQSTSTWSSGLTGYTHRIGCFILEEIGPDHSSLRPFSQLCERKDPLFDAALSVLTLYLYSVRKAPMTAMAKNATSVMETNDVLVE